MGLIKNLLTSEGRHGRVISSRVISIQIELLITFLIKYSAILTKQGLL